MDNKMIAYDKKYYAVMANDIVKGKQEMTLMEARIIRLLITQVVKQDPELKTYTCRIQDLAEFLDITSQTLYQDIKDICKKLLSRVVQIGTGNPKKPWKMFQWISMAEYDGDGNITLKISEELSPFLIDLNAWFTQYQLQNILSFNSFYAIRLYEILKCEIGITRENNEYFDFTIDELKKIFSCEKKYKQTADFIKKVIIVGVREINSKSDIEVEYEYIKTSKKITSIRFYVWYNVKNNFKRKEELNDESIIV